MGTELHVCMHSHGRPLEWLTTSIAAPLANTCNEGHSSISSALGMALSNHKADNTTPPHMTMCSCEMQLWVVSSTVHTVVKHCQLTKPSCAVLWLQHVSSIAEKHYDAVDNRGQCVAGVVPGKQATQGCMYVAAYSVGRQ